MTLRLYLDKPPSLNHLFPTGRGGRRIKSTAYRTWRDAQTFVAMPQRPKPVTGSVTVSVTLSDKLVLADTDNNLKALLDLLVDWGLIEGDNKRIVRRITVEWGDPTWAGHQMGCLVEVSPFEENL